MTIYAFDGTWNDAEAIKVPAGTERYTNVFWFKESYEGENFYANGPGTRGGRIGKLLGGLSGLGSSTRIDEGFKELQKRFKNGDEVIDIIGYSRGAAIARMFVETIRENYDQIQDSKGNSLKSPPTIRFLGLFDTVASFGIPWTESEHNFTPKIPPFVINTYHAMALDESRETFGIERCFGDRENITEVWFRGGHGDIGGNAVIESRGIHTTNRSRSDISLNWMLSKASACGLPIKTKSRSTSSNAPITAEQVKIKGFTIPEPGNIGTLSRRIYLGDLIHFSVEHTELVETFDGNKLRRINVPTRIEDEYLEKSANVTHWTPTYASTVESESDSLMKQFINPHLIELSSRRYPFDIQPARTWRAWLTLWDLEDTDFDPQKMNVFWAPSPQDRGLAWDVMVELATRITTQTLSDDEGDEASALKSIYELFPSFRVFLHNHGPSSANTAFLINFYLNKHVRPFTAEWHKRSLRSELESKEVATEFRSALRKVLQPKLKRLHKALSVTVDAEL